MWLPYCFFLLLCLINEGLAKSTCKPKLTGGLSNIRTPQVSQISGLNFNPLFGSPPSSSTSSVTTSTNTPNPSGNTVTTETKSKVEKQSSCSSKNPSIQELIANSKGLMKQFISNGQFVTPSQASLARVCPGQPASNVAVCSVNSTPTSPSSSPNIQCPSNYRKESVLIQPSQNTCLKTLQTQTSSPQKPSPTISSPPTPKVTSNCPSSSCLPNGIQYLTTNLPLSFSSQNTIPSPQNSCPALGSFQSNAPQNLIIDQSLLSYLNNAPQNQVISNMPIQQPTIVQQVKPQQDLPLPVPCPAQTPLPPPIEGPIQLGPSQLTNIVTPNSILSPPPCQSQNVILTQIPFDQINNLPRDPVCPTQNNINVQTIPQIQIVRDSFVNQQSQIPNLIQINPSIINFAKPPVTNGPCPQTLSNQLSALQLQTLLSSQQSCPINPEFIPFIQSLPNQETFTPTSIPFSFIPSSYVEEIPYAEFENVESLNQPEIKNLLNNYPVISFDVPEVSILSDVSCSGYLPTVLGSGFPQGQVTNSGTPNKIASPTSNPEPVETCTPVNADVNQEDVIPLSKIIESINNVASKYADNFLQAVRQNGLPFTVTSPVTTFETPVTNNVNEIAPSDPNSDVITTQDVSSLQQSFVSNTVVTTESSPDLSVNAPTSTVTFKIVPPSTDSSVEIPSNVFLTLAPEIDPCCLYSLQRKYPSVLQIVLEEDSAELTRLFTFMILAEILNGESGIA